MRILRRRQFGDPILRQKARRLSGDQILSNEVQELVKGMRHTLVSRNYGVGIAAPQVGHSIALSVIELRSTRTRPNLPKKEWVSMIIINPKIIKTYGKPEQKWESCLSLDNVFAKAQRYQKVRIKWQDENAKSHERDIGGLLAHVLQHEIDHLDGVLFVDKVKDTKSYISESEYNKMMKKGKA